MNLSEKISILQILKDLSLKEADLIWKRFTSMLYVNTGLLGIVTFAIEKNQSAMILGCSLVGIVISIIWIQIIRLSRYYYRIWKVDANELIRKDAELSEIIKGHIDPRVEHPKYAPGVASSYAIAIPVCFLFLWFMVIINLKFNGLMV